MGARAGGGLVARIIQEQLHFQFSLFGLLGLLLAMLILGINGLMQPPLWVPRLVYGLIVAVLAGVVLKSLSKLVVEWRSSRTSMSAMIKESCRRDPLRLEIPLLGLCALLVCLPLALSWIRDPPGWNWMRVAYGVGVAPAYFAKLAALGYIMGGLVLMLPLLISTCCCCTLLGPRLQRQRRLRRVLGQAPFIDLVENRTTINYLMPMLFVYGFALPTSFVLAGSILIGPAQALPTAAGTPSSLTPLCRGALASLFQPQAAELAGDRAMGWALWDAQWRARFEPLPDLCSTATTEAASEQLGGEGGGAIMTSLALNASTASGLLPLCNLTAQLAFVLRDARRIGVGGVRIEASVVRFEPSAEDVGAGAAPCVSVCEILKTDQKSAHHEEPGEVWREGGVC